MKKLAAFQIDIPQPCTQSWDDMTPDGSGRHCDSCMKTVIDFTTWSDAELFNYFTPNRGTVCGRFLNTQLRRPIQIPYQPHSRLYRIAVAMGFTLMFVYAPEVRAQYKVPMVVPDSVVGPDFARKSCTTHDSDGLAEIRGVVMDNKKEPLVNATVQLFQNGKAKGGTITDFDGAYSIKGLDSGSYELKVSYIGYKTTNQPVMLGADNLVKVTTVLVPDGKLHNQIVELILGGVRPLTNQYKDSLKTSTRSKK